MLYITVDPNTLAEEGIADDYDISDINYAMEDLENFGSSRKDAHHFKLQTYLEFKEYIL